MYTQLETKDGFRISVEEGILYIRVLLETTNPGGREALDKLQSFIRGLEQISVVEIMQRKVPGMAKKHEPDCVVLKLFR